MIKLTGDGFLAEFGAVKDAVSCALAMQSLLAGLPLDFRMGLHVGDVVDDGDHIHGEVVNPAARGLPGLTRYRTNPREYL